MHKEEKRGENNTGAWMVGRAGRRSLPRRRSARASFFCQSLFRHFSFLSAITEERLVGSLFWPKEGKENETRSSAPFSFDCGPDFALAATSALYLMRCHTVVWIGPSALVPPKGGTTNRGGL